MNLYFCKVLPEVNLLMPISIALNISDNLQNSLGEQFYQEEVE
jgi:hypothetical protein